MQESKQVRRNAWQRFQDCSQARLQSNTAKTMLMMRLAVSGKDYRKYIAAWIRLQTRTKGWTIVTTTMVKKEANVVWGDQTIRSAFRNRGAGRKLMQPSNAQASMPACGPIFAAEANLQ